MPNKLRVLSGQEIVKFLEKNGFTTRSCRGSHAKLKRVVDGEDQTLIVPLRKSVARGTLRDIYDQILGYLPESLGVKNLFYTD